MNIKGITTIFAEKKWVFTYAVLALCHFKLDTVQFVQVLVILMPSVFALAAADKYTKMDKSKK